MHKLILVAALLALPCAAQVTPLTPGSPVERDIQPGETHTYQVHIETGQFLHVTAAQLASDLQLRLVLPGGTPLTQVDRLPYGGYEDVPWIANTSGECKVEVRGRSGSKPGRYRLDHVVRAPSEQDRARSAAFIESWIEAEALLAKKDAASVREAARKFELAATGWLTAGDPRWEAYSLSQAALAQYTLNAYPKARELLEHSLKIRRGLGSGMVERYSLSVTLNGLGRVLSALGDTQGSIDYYNEALRIRREEGDRLGEAVLLTNLGLLYKRTSDFDKGLEVLNQALAIRRQLGDSAGESITLGALADTYFVTDDFQAALDRYTEVWRIRAGSGDKVGIANTLYNLGTVYFQLGQPALAHQYWNQAEPLFRETGQTQALGSLFYARGQDHIRSGNPAAALASFEEALTIHRGVALAVATVNDLNSSCSALVSLGQLEKAQSRGAEALDLSRKINYRNGAGTALECLGRYALDKGDLQQARARFSESLDVSRSTGIRETQVVAALGLAAVERAAGNLAAGLAFMEEATYLGESVRARTNDPNLRASYRASRAPRIELHTDLLMKMHLREPAAGYNEQAFNLAERWRARSLAEMIYESADDLRQELTAEQRLQEDGLLAGISRIQRELFRPGVAEPRQQELKTKLAGAERELDLFRNELRRGGNRYAASQYADILDANAIRRRMLLPDTALIEYALGEQQSYVWALTRSGIAGASLPPRAEIEQRIGAYRKLLSERVTALTAASALARLDAEGRTLYQLLIAPLETSLAGKKRVLIVPDGALSYLPFEALPGAGRMIERFSIGYAPSASTLAALQERAAQRGGTDRMLLAFADPTVAGAQTLKGALATYRERGFAFAPLPNARTEVTAIRSLFSPTASHVYTGAEAQESSLKTEKLESYRYLHFAAHGYFDEEEPARSGIVLSPGADASTDGVLQAPEIMRLRLNADLVTLSACQSGLGRLLAGEGVMGLTRAFLYAGAQSLVVSLWNVNDAATAELMKQFYSNLKAGLPRDEALRRAKLALMKTPSSPWRHPYFWAPFVFVGDPGR